MGAFKDVVFDIQDEIRRGDLSYAEIAQRYDVPLETVEEILDEMIQNEADYDDSADADAEALASAGFGTDEDYGYYGDDY